MAPASWVIAARNCQLGHHQGAGRVLGPAGDGATTDPASAGGASTSAPFDPQRTWATKGPQRTWPTGSSTSSGKCGHQKVLADAADRAIVRSMVRRIRLCNDVLALNPREVR